MTRVNLGRAMQRTAILVAALVCADRTAAAQVRPFLYSFVPARGEATTAVVYGDVAYGRKLFTGLGPEGLEQRFGLQLPLTRRLTLAAQAGWAPEDATLSSDAMIQGEVLANLASPSSRTMLAVGVGGMHDYQRTSVALGRVVAGYRWANTLAIANVRLEHAFPKSSAPADRRDALDILTSLGVMKDVTPSLRVGVESVAEDLEGFFETDEAEGGAKLMLGPSIGIGRKRWTFQITAGPAVHLTHSTAVGGGSGAPRDLTGTGFVVRTSLGMQW